MIDTPTRSQPQESADIEIVNVTKIEPAYHST